MTLDDEKDLKPWHRAHGAIRWRAGEQRVALALVRAANTLLEEREYAVQARFNFGPYDPDGHLIESNDLPDGDWEDIWHHPNALPLPRAVSGLLEDISRWRVELGSIECELLDELVEDPAPPRAKPKRRRTREKKVAGNESGPGTNGRSH